MQIHKITVRQQYYSPAAKNLIMSQISSLSKKTTCIIEEVAYLGFWLWGLHLDRHPFPSLPSLPFSSFPSPSLSSPSHSFPLSFSSPPLPLEVGPLIHLGGLEERCKFSSPGRVWGGAPAEIEFGAF